MSLNPFGCISEQILKFFLFFLEAHLISAFTDFTGEMTVPRQLGPEGGRHYCGRRFFRGVSPGSYCGRRQARHLSVASPQSGL